MGTESDSPVRKTGYRQRLGKDHSQDGVRVVVRERESRSHGEGGQGIGTISKPEKRTMDLVHQADHAWVLNVQRKLYQWSQNYPTEAYRELWNWLTDLRNLREAWRRVAQNKGKRTPGIDGITAGSIRQRIG
ncbi:reverse transcriptase N-terminal domain-containing protein [Dyadobacter jiangsuensis]|nr:reverse transcriptase N-terminal domain-containing protein [Dyadobacter jiangsuensis]